MWEDDANKRGGKWIVNFDKKQRMAGEVIKMIIVLLCVFSLSLSGKILYILSRLTAFGLTLFLAS